MQHYQRIRDLREDHDLTQEELCKQLHMHKTTYTNYEQGKHTVPLDFAVLLADFYDVSLDYLAGRRQYLQKLRMQENGNALPDADALKIMEQYIHLTERNKGRLEQFLDQLTEKQTEEQLQKIVPKSA